MWYILTKEYYSEIKRNETLIHAGKQIIFEGIMLCERSHIAQFCLNEMSRISKCNRDGKETHGYT